MGRTASFPGEDGLRALLRKASTSDLLDELQDRDGVDAWGIEAGETETLEVSGPAVVYVITEEAEDMP